MFENSVDKESSFADLWEESEMKAIIAEVQSRKSVDTLKLFGGPNGSLPEALSARTAADVKDKIDHCKGSFDSEIAPWVPKCGVPELLAVLASEAAFCRNQRLKAVEAREQLQMDKKERVKADCACKEAKKELQEVVAQLDAETALRRGVEEEKMQFQDALAEAKTEVDDEILRREKKEHELDEIKLNEIDARRRLDRARLKVAALRGELVAPAMDSLIRPEFLQKRQNSCEDNGVSAKASGNVAHDDDNLMSIAARPLSPAPLLSAVSKMTDPSTKFAKTVQREDEEHDLDVEMKDVNGTCPSSVRVEKDENIPMSPKEREAASTASGVGSDASVASAGGMGVDRDGFDESILASEQVEDEKSMELRLLRNRLAMHMAEAEDWRLSAAAERRKLKLVELAKSRLEEDMSRHASASHGQGRGVIKARGKRAAVSQDVVPSTSQGVNSTRGGDVVEVEKKNVRKRRKGAPHRALVLSS